MQTDRRKFLKMVAVGAVGSTLPSYGRQGERRPAASKAVAQTALPRWRGFNLLDMFTMRSRGDFPEDDFRWIRDFGFDFVRFPMCYRLWIEDGDDYKIHEPMLEKLDRAVELGRVETWRGGLGGACLLPALSSAGASIAPPCSVSTPRSSNRTCGFAASGSPSESQAFAFSMSDRRVGIGYNPSVR